MDGLRLTFHLAGINNQNFLMRDEETGSYWQQISGKAIAGPLNGKQLRLVRSDELTMGLWRKEQPGGTVLADDPKAVAEYVKPDWDVDMKKTPTVLQHAEPGRSARDLVLGVHAFGVSRAYLMEQVLKEKLLLDRIGSEPVIVVVGSDGESVRVFRARVYGEEAEFFRNTDASQSLMRDAATGSAWNFQGCAVEGPANGQCLEPIAAIQDYWFDWREYNPQGVVFRR